MQGKEVSEVMHLFPWILPFRVSWMGFVPWPGVIAPFQVVLSQQHNLTWVLVTSTPLEGFPSGSASKESTCNTRDSSPIPGLGKSPGRGHGNPLQHSCLENPHGQGMGSQRVGQNWATKHSTALKISSRVDELSRLSSLHIYPYIIPLLNFSRTILIFTCAIYFLTGPALITMRQTIVFINQVLLEHDLLIAYV